MKLGFLELPPDERRLYIEQAKVQPVSSRPDFFQK